MRFDNVIQQGVWVGSVEQIACVEQNARDANFEDYDSIAQYLDRIQDSHDEEGTDFDRGPIDDDARMHYTVAFEAAWRKRPRSTRGG